MSTPETPRVWTLSRELPSVPSDLRPIGPWKIKVAGPTPWKHEDKEVVEKAPVDAERERMLDLLERLTGDLRLTGKAHYGAEAEAVALLREHKRLGDS